MAVTYSTALKSARMQAVADAIDGGSGPGVLEIGTTAMGSVLATIPLADPCGAVASGVLTFDFSPAVEDSSADNSGTAAAARIKDSNGNVIISGLTVGTSGSDLNLVTTTVVATQPVQLTSGTITHA